MAAPRVRPCRRARPPPPGCAASAPASWWPPSSRAGSSLSGRPGAGRRPARPRTPARSAPCATASEPPATPGWRCSGPAPAAPTPPTGPVGSSPTPSRRRQLDTEFELKTAEQVTEALGHMKGALMKLGQMASYLDQGLPEHVRERAGRAPARRAADERRAGRRGRGGRAGRPTRGGLRRMGPGPHRLGLHRAGPPGHHPRRRRGGRQGPVPGGRRGGRRRPRQRRVHLRRARSAVPRPRPPLDRGRAAGPPGRGARLPPRGPQPTALRRQLRGPPDDPRPARLPRPPHRPRAHHGAGRRRPVGRAAHLDPTRAATWPPRRSTASPSAACTDWQRLQRRSSPRQLPVPSWGPGHVPGLRSGEALHPDRDRRVRRDDQPHRDRPRSRRLPGHGRADRAAARGARRDRRRGRRLPGPLLRVRAATTGPTRSRRRTAPRRCAASSTRRGPTPRCRRRPTCRPAS